MDCRTARLLLPFDRPHAPELAPDEAGALGQHLDRCPDCHGLADAERRLDEQVGRAVRQVEVPAGLREQLLARLEIDRGDWYRRRFGHGLRIAAAVAALVLLVWGWWVWRGPRLPGIDLGGVDQNFRQAMQADKRAMAAATLKKMGWNVPPSPQLNYELLSAPPALADLPGSPGQKVPLLVFDQAGPPYRHAVVYVVHGSQLPADANLPPGSGLYKLEVIPALPGENYAYLVFHNGENLDWLRPPDPPAT